MTNNSEKTATNNSEKSATNNSETYRFNVESGVSSGGCQMLGGVPRRVGASGALQEKHATEDIWDLNFRHRSESRLH